MHLIQVKVYLASATGERTSCECVYVYLLSSVILDALYVVDFSLIILLQAKRAWLVLPWPTEVGYENVLRSL